MKHIVILGGGTAGWLTAAVLAAEFDPDSGVNITLIESPSTPTIGVGEGTWPSMRSTLLKIGISETEFISTCSATLKQGTRFTSWTYGNGETYYHPFTLPHGYTEINLAEYWSQGLLGDSTFADSVTPQFSVCEAGLAPKQINVPEYAYTLNYGYHLDAGKFAALLSQHATAHLGVKHVSADVTAVTSHPNGDIAALETDQGPISADLFVDCSGFRSLLLGQHYEVPVATMDHVLFNDRALAVQVPYSSPDAAIATTTRATAHRTGWFWDIGLQHRRGVGAVFSSQHSGVAEVEADLDDYLKATGHKGGLAKHAPRLIEFTPGYRKSFWHRNCLAIGLSAGFIEPLEASALVLVELSARFLADQLPRDRRQMDTVSKRFNAEFTERWAQIIEFLKLHYVLSRREDSAYWKDHRLEATIPTALSEKLSDWHFRSPWHRDERRVDEMFPAASYQYVLYGMDFKTEINLSNRRSAPAKLKHAERLAGEVKNQRAQFTGRLPPHRGLIEQAKHQGFARRT
jgi:tryptophan 7-halogenase